MFKFRALAVFGLVCILMCFAGTITTPAINTTLKTSAMHSVNNEDINIDFKLTDSDFKIIYDIVCNHTELSGVDKDETDALKNTTRQRNLSEYFGEPSDEYIKSAITWLINNNVYSRPHNIIFSSGYASSVLLPDGNSNSIDGDGNDIVDQDAWLSVNAYAKKADFYMMLYKAQNGIKVSNVCLYNGSSIRNASRADSITPVSSIADYTSRFTYNGRVSDYWGDNLNASFSGDVYTYVSPDVYELYFKELVDEGIIQLSEFSETSSKGTGFVRDYKNFESADWNTRKETFTPNNGSHALGYSVKISGAGLQRSMAPNYFKENKISVMDALGTIATYLRQTEKEISKTEAKVVAYKYGLMYFSELSEEDRDTLYFLIAKGILNCDDMSRMINTSGYLTRAQMYELLYRVANKEARYDFSKVQLTDSDSELSSLGFAETKCDVVAASIVPIRRITGTKLYRGDLHEGSFKSQGDSVVDTAIAKGFSILHDMLAFVGVYTVADADQIQNTLNTYAVSMQFDLKSRKNGGSLKPTGNTYLYKDGDDEFTLNEDLKADEHDSIISTKVNEIKYSGTDVQVLTVTFQVSAPSKTEAQKRVIKGITTKVNNKTISTVLGISKVEDTKTNKVCTLMEQTVIQKSFSEIIFLADKVLINSKTGVKAIIAPEKGIALVGNTVIKSSNIMLMTNSANTKKYYNVELICGLISSTSFNNAGFNNQSNNTIYTINAISEKVIKSVKFDTYTSKDAGTNAYYITADKKKGTLNDKNGDNVPLYNTSSICDGLSTLIRTFDVPKTDSDPSDTTKVTLIVDFKFYVPPVDLVARDAWFKINEIKDNEDLTLQDVIDFESSRPESGTLMAEYWDSNIAFSNAIANFMYGTSKEEWITCGYIVPQVHACIHGMKSSGAQISTSLKKHGDTNGNGYSDGEEILQRLFFGTDDVENFAYLSKYSKYLMNDNAAYWWVAYLAANGISAKNSSDIDALQLFMQTVRKFDISYQFKETDNGVLYKQDKNNISYYIMNSGVVYRSFALDDRLTAFYSGKDINSVKIYAKTTGSVNTSNKRVLEPENANKEITYQKKKYYYGGTRNGNIILYPAEPITSYFSGDVLEKLLVDLTLACVSTVDENGNVSVFVDITNVNNNKDSLVRTYDEIQTKLFGKNSDLNSISWSDLLTINVSAREKVMQSFWSPAKLASYKDAFISSSVLSGSNSFIAIGSCDDKNASDGRGSGSAFITNGRYQVPLDGSGAVKKVIAANIGNTSKADIEFGALATPVFFLSNNYWEFKCNTLKKSSTINILMDKLQVFTPSINDFVISVTLDNDIGTTTVDRLDAGTRLTIEDTVWVKQIDGSWVSNPIKDPSLVMRCRDNEPDEVKTAIGLFFQSLQLSYNGTRYPFVNYVRAKENSNMPAAQLAQCNEAEDIVVLKKGVLCVSEDGSVVVRKQKNEKDGVAKIVEQSLKYTSKFPENVVLQMYLDPSLKVRPVTANRSVYTVCVNVGEGIVGNAAYSLLNEPLNYQTRDDIDVSLMNNKFMPSGLFASIKNAFNKESNTMLAKESIQFIMYLVLMLASYLLIMSWLAFCVLTRGTGRVFFVKIAEATSRLGKGFDAFKFFTFGIYSLDNAPTSSRCVIISFVCCIVVAVCLVAL
ncbi:hypothetical protein AALB53_08420 [Lachnospiraceae bacterium 47-T17]